MSTDHTYINKNDINSEESGQEAASRSVEPSPAENDGRNSASVLSDTYGERAATQGGGFVGRFAPSPTGRMHLGNLFTALMSWLSARAAGGRWILRIEDLDPQRSKLHFAHQIEDDLQWLGLDWDEGGTANLGPNGPYSQSLRSEIYEEFLGRLRATGYTYPCRCTRADIMATQAPHQSDGRVIYGGRCRPEQLPSPTPALAPQGVKAATRLWVPDREIEFTDRVFGAVSVNLANHCGDFVVQRADGAWAYQLAVVVDDALMGVTEVMRGHDLLLSGAQQLYLYRLLGLPAPSFAHLPLICNAAGVRLSKRDAAMGADALRERYTPAQLRGVLAHLARLIPEPTPMELPDLVALFSYAALPEQPTILLP